MSGHERHERFPCICNALAANFAYVEFLGHLGARAHAVAARNLTAARPTAADAFGRVLVPRAVLADNLAAFVKSPVLTPMRLRAAQYVRCAHVVAAQLEIESKT